MERSSLMTTAVATAAFAVVYTIFVLAVYDSGALAKILSIVVAVAVFGAVMAWFTARRARNARSGLSR